MVTTDLKLDEPGTLPHPGPIGRLVRLLFGILCLWYVHGLLDVSGDLINANGSIHPVVWNGIFPGLFLVSYVVNIGYSRAWKKYPAMFSAVLLASVAGVGYMTSGSIETHWLARSRWVWGCDLFAHLGLACIVAGVSGAPGCEMRAFHHLYSRLTGVPAMEHACPVGPLRSIDQWEAARAS